MDKIAIFGVPRSGTSWLSQIINSHPDVVLRFQPLFSYGHKGRLTDHSTDDEINRFFFEIIHSQDPFALMHSDIHESYPDFVKSASPTHIAFKETRYLHIIENILGRESDVKILGIVRNPMATLASWIQLPKEFKPEWNIHQEWRLAQRKNQGKPEEFFGFEKWKIAAENFLRFEKEYANLFKLVRYDKLNTNTLETANTIFNFIGLNMHPQVSEFIEASSAVHEANPYSVYRSKANDNQWRGILPSDIVREIQNELHNSPLQSFCVESDAP